LPFMFWSCRSLCCYDCFCYLGTYLMVRIM
jgi:hypothetical protein